jgi:RNA polymerase sigma-70 factor (ECF subfamily)
MPQEPEPLGLLGLMLLHEARRPTRTDDGVLVTLEHQDRSRWDRSLISEGVATLDQALAMRRAGPYQLQAAIAACHATVPDVASTDWPQIAAMYTELARLAPSPIVDLNRAVAVAMADGIPAGLALVDEIAASGRLDGYHLLPATRADLLRRAGRTTEARAAYEEARKLAPTDAERRYLSERLHTSENFSPGRCPSRPFSFVGEAKPPNRRKVS